MPAVSNKTHRPLSVPLPGGKKLHIGPGKTAQVAAKALDHAPLKKLVDAGEIEVVSDEIQHTSGPGGDTKGGTLEGHTGGIIRRSGDR
jgi:hypothetical protein